MKIIIVRQTGHNWALHISRSMLAAAAVLSVTLLGGGLWWAGLGQEEVDAQVVESWRAKLNEQKALVVELAKRSELQSAAVGRKLAKMQARLLRMEAIGAHLTDAADLDQEEFDFAMAPAQGGPVDASQITIGWQELSSELDSLAAQLKRRESELKILDSVLVHEDIKQNSIVRGRPVRWGWLSSPYGQRVDPITGRTAWHSGVDFAGRDGSDVIAVASGVVTYAGERSGYGKMVEISHSGGYVTRYAHHKSVSVTPGDVVKKGETIGHMGSSGRSTGPHVHFEVLKHGRTVDPAKYVAIRG